MRACGVLPPMDETISWAGSSPSAKPRRPATRRAGLAGRQPSEAHDPDAVRAPDQGAPAGARRARGATPSQSSAAARSAAAMSSSGSGRSVGSRPASGGVVTWPTPTTTGVRGSRAMAAAAYRFTPRGLPGPPVDSVLVRVVRVVRMAVGSRRGARAAKPAQPDHQPADQTTPEGIP